MGGGFLAFCPGDDRGIKDVAREQAIQIINSDLGQLLQQDASSFWAIVQQDPSLMTCLASYLQFKRRAHDEDVDDGIQGVASAEQELARRVFMVLLRIVSSNEYGREVPNSSQKAQWLYEHRALDIPKLMDVAALYGPTNPDLARQLISNALQLQPLFLDELQMLVEPMIANIQQLVDSGSTIANKASRGDNVAANQLLDMLSYVQDLCVTLGSFIGCHPPAAALLLQPGQGQLMASLATLHDKLLPQLVAAVSQASTTDKLKQGQTVAAGLQQLTLQLLSLAYLVPPQETAPAAAGASSGGGSSSSHQAGGSSSGAAGGSSSAASSSRAAPSGSSSSAYAGAGANGPSHNAGSTAEQRGTGLMSAVMCGALEGGAAHEGHDTKNAPQQLLHAVNRRFRLDVMVACAMQQGTIALDEAQFDYLLALVDSHDRQQVQSLARQLAAGKGAANTATGGASTSQAAGSSQGATSSSLANGGSSGSQTTTSEQCDPAVLASLISQIKELMGDAYGDGYLIACLHAYNYNAEQVLNALLEGSLKPELQSLDTKLATWTPPASKPAAAPGQDSLSWSSLAADAAELQRKQAAAMAARTVPPPLTQPSNKSQMHRGVARVLGKLDNEVKAATRVLANELQWEYDDEYDDSYDDLIRTGAAGLADVEGDDVVPSQVGVPSYDDEPDDSAVRPGPRQRGPMPVDGGQRGDVAGRGGRGVGRGRSSPIPAASTTSSSTAAAAAAAASMAGGSTLASGRPARAPLSTASAPAPRGGGRGGPGGGRGARGGRPGKLWVLDGRIYNYAKEGAMEVEGQAAADQAVQEAKEAATYIMGLGAGGNKGAAGSRWSAIQQAGRPAPHTSTTANPADNEEDGGGDEEAGPQGAGSGGRGGGRGGRGGRGGGGRGGGRGEGGGPQQPNYARKEQNKSAVANHHRKDRAFKKMGMM